MPRRTIYKGDDSSRGRSDLPARVLRILLMVLIVTELPLALRKPGLEAPFDYWPIVWVALILFGLWSQAGWALFLCLLRFGGELAVDHWQVPLGVQMKEPAPSAEYAGAVLILTGLNYLVGYRRA